MFENKMKELMHNYEVEAPDLMNKVFEKRTPLYVFANKLALHKYKLLVATLAIGVLFWFGFNKELNGRFDAKPTHQAQQTVENKASSDETTFNDDVNEKVVKSAENEVSTEINGNISLVDLNKKAAKQTQITADKNITIHNETTAEREIETPEIVEIDEHKLPNEKVEEVNPQVENPKIEVVQTEEKTVDKMIDEIEDEKPLVAETEDDGANENKQIGDLIIKPSKWSASLAYGPSIGVRKFAGEGENTLIDARNLSEKQRYSHAADLLVSYRFKPAFEAFVGASYFDRREKMSYQKTTSTNNMFITSHTVKEYHPVFGVRDVTIYDTTFSTTTTTQNFVSKNSYQHLTLPIGLRMGHYRAKDGIYISASTGLDFVLKTRGMVMDENLLPIDLGSGFKRMTIGNSISTGVGYTRLLSANSSLFVEYRQRWYLSPTNRETYPINQFDRAHNLMFGWKFGF
ncbi:MAG: hypothetical protein H6607_04020 [Flavobacteriales bacterium]|nr:hypothetical protein [Flavobacteriales bacterium]